jgi:hypothetical protein
VGRVAFRTAFLSAIAVTCAAGAALLLAGFFGRVTVELPGVLEVRTGAAHQAELWFSGLALPVLVVLLSMVIWLAGRAVRS